MAQQIKTAAVRQRKGTTAPKPKTEGSVIDRLGRKPGIPRTLKGVFFGPPKSGKTTLACTGKNVLLISFDPDGADTMTLKGREDITVVEPETWGETEALLRELHSGGAADYEWIVIDSVTFLFQMVGGKDLYLAARDNTDPRRVYGKTGAAVSQLINDFCALRDTNVIFTAHLETERDDEDGVVLEAELDKYQVKVAVTPMVWKTLGPGVSFIGRTYKKRVMEPDDKGVKRPVIKHFVSFNDGERSPAGSRFEMAGEYEVGPGLLDTLHKQLTEGGG